MEPTEAEKVEYRDLVAAARRLGVQYAFPTALSDGPEHMDLRTWLAGQALAGLTLRAIGTAESIVQVAGTAVLVADATLVELSRKRS